MTDAEFLRSVAAYVGAVGEEVGASTERMTSGLRRIAEEWEGVKRREEFAVQAEEAETFGDYSIFSTEAAAQKFRRRFYSDKGAILHRVNFARIGPWKLYTDSEDHS